MSVIKIDKAVIKANHLYVSLINKSTLRNNLI